MANTSSARKRVRQAVKHRQHNVSQRTELRTRIKAVVKSIHAGDKASAEATFKLAQPCIDSAVGKKLIHANKAARHKSRLNARIKAM
ncbi:MAG: 30S ribosomal protein S20 [Gammaproteobacteria bacterium]|nr:30S ribosomal protein S20 [Gammaproteobacteria bacterium]